MRVSVECRVEPTARVQQVAGLFDLELTPFSRLAWDVELPIADPNVPWSIGLIAGPSGSGKSTLARRLLTGDGFLWADTLPAWPEGRSILDGFPAELSVKDVTALLSAVGFSSPPAWLRPYRVLSTGQQMRADLARLIAALTALTGEGRELKPVGVMDEFTSVVDRTVAKVGSAALAKAVRPRGLKFVAVTCHDDVIDWLQPDWILSTATSPPAFARRSLCPRPAVHVELVRTTAAAWPVFAPHHYLNHSLSHAACCFLASVQLPGDPTPRPAAFSAWVNQLSLKGGKREHRTVVLPDFQGIGLGAHVSATLAAMWAGLGYKATSTTTHPAFIAARARSPLWVLRRKPSLGARGSRASLANPKGLRHAATRLTAGFEYVGPPMPREQAAALLSA